MSKPEVKGWFVADPRGHFFHTEGDGDWNTLPLEVVDLLYNNSAASRDVLNTSRHRSYWPNTQLGFVWAGWTRSAEGPVSALFNPNKHIIVTTDKRHKNISSSDNQTPWNTQLPVLLWHYISLKFLSSSHWGVWSQQRLRSKLILFQPVLGAAHTLSLDFRLLLMKQFDGNMDTSEIAMEIKGKGWVDKVEYIDHNWCAKNKGTADKEASKMLRWPRCHIKTIPTCLCLVYLYN